LELKMTTHKIQRNSRQRQVILEELRKLNSHPTAAALYEVVRERLPSISLGTVYRNLDLLAKQGQIRKIWTPGKEARFDGNQEEHYHLHCVSCGKIDDLHDLPSDPVKNEYVDLKGYRILGHHLEFMGLCPVCKNQDESETKTDNSY
jgi:Fur family ferric uptake transcriptional regulator